MMAEFSRIDRIESLFKAEIAGILDYELDNPNFPDFITVSRVKVSKDLSEGLVLVSLVDESSDELMKTTIEELNKAAGYIRSLLARRVKLKRHPRLKFAYNDSARYALRIEEVFHRISHELAETDPVETEENEPE
jgi:ribosome-binding factor A